MLGKFKQAARNVTEKFSDKFYDSSFVFGSTIAAGSGAGKYLVSDETLFSCIAYGVFMGTAAVVFLSESEKSGSLYSVAKSMVYGAAAMTLCMFGGLIAYHGFVEPVAIQIKNKAIVAQVEKMPWREGQQFRVDGFLNKNDVVTIKKSLTTSSRRPAMLFIVRSWT